MLEAADDAPSCKQSMDEARPFVSYRLSGRPAYGKLDAPASPTATTLYPHYVDRLTEPKPGGFSTLLELHLLQPGFVRGMIHFPPPTAQTD